MLFPEGFDPERFEYAFWLLVIFAGFSHLFLGLLHKTNLSPLVVWFCFGYHVLYADTVVGSYMFFPAIVFIFSVFTDLKVGKSYGYPYIKCFVTRRTASTRPEMCRPPKMMPEYPLDVPPSHHD